MSRVGLQHLPILLDGFVVFAELEVAVAEDHLGADAAADLDGAMSEPHRLRILPALERDLGQARQRRPALEPGAAHAVVELLGLGVALGDGRFVRFSQHAARPSAARAPATSTASTAAAAPARSRGSASPATRDRAEHPDAAPPAASARRSPCASAPP